MLKLPKYLEDFITDGNYIHFSETEDCDNRRFGKIPKEHSKDDYLEHFIPDDPRTVFLKIIATFVIEDNKSPLTEMEKAGPHTREKLPWRMPGPDGDGEIGLRHEDATTSFRLYVATESGLDAWQEWNGAPLTDKQRRHVVMLDKFSWEAVVDRMYEIAQSCIRDSWQEMLRALSEHFEWWAEKNRELSEYPSPELFTLEALINASWRETFIERYDEDPRSYPANIYGPLAREMLPLYKTKRPMPWECQDQDQLSRYYGRYQGYLLADFYKDFCFYDEYRSEEEEFSIYTSDETRIYLPPDLTLDRLVKEAPLPPTDRALELLDALKADIDKREPT